jgi:hypothetical protein
MREYQGRGITLLHRVIEQLGWSGNCYDLHLVGPRFESRPGHWLSWPTGSWFSWVLDKALYLVVLLVTACLISSSTLKMDWISSSETLVNPTTRHHIPEDSIVHSPCCENFNHNTCLVSRKKNLNVKLEAFLFNSSNVIPNNLLLTGVACLCPRHIFRHLPAC